MSSTRLAGVSFVIVMALLPALLLRLADTSVLASQAEDAAVMREVAAGRAQEPPRQPWEGAVRTETAPAATAKPAPAAPSADPTACPPVLELYVSQDEAARLIGELGAATAARAVVLCFGPDGPKARGGSGVDPFLPLESGKRRRAYARVLSDGRRTSGPIVAATPSQVRSPAGAGTSWLSELVADAQEAAPAELALRATARAAQKEDAAAPGVSVTFAAKARAAAGSTAPGKAGGATMSDDVTLNLALVQELVGADGQTRVPRVVAFKAFRLPRGGAGTAELTIPTNAAPVRIVGWLQHDKTMRTLAVARADLK